MTKKRYHWLAAALPSLYRRPPQFLVSTGSVDRLPNERKGSSSFDAPCKEFKKCDKVYGIDRTNRTDRRKERRKSKEISNNCRDARSAISSAEQKWRSETDSKSRDGRCIQLRNNWTECDHLAESSNMAHDNTYLSGKDRSNLQEMCTEKLMSISNPYLKNSTFTIESKQKLELLENTRIPKFLNNGKSFSCPSNLEKIHLEGYNDLKIMHYKVEENDHFQKYSRSKSVQSFRKSSPYNNLVSSLPSRSVSSCSSRFCFSNTQPKKNIDNTSIEALQINEYFETSNNAADSINKIKSCEYNSSVTPSFSKLRRSTESLPLTSKFRKTSCHNLTSENYTPKQRKHFRCSNFVLAPKKRKTSKQDPNLAEDTRELDFTATEARRIKSHLKTLFSCNTEDDLQCDDEDQISQKEVASSQYASKHYNFQKIPWMVVSKPWTNLNWRIAKELKTKVYVRNLQVIYQIALRVWTTYTIEMKRKENPNSIYPIGR